MDQDGVSAFSDIESRAGKRSLTSNDQRNTRNMAKKSSLFFLRGQPDVLFGENLTMERFKSHSAEREQQMKRLQDDMVKAPNKDALKKHREMLHQKLNEKKWELVQKTMELKDLEMRKRVLESIKAGSVQEKLGDDVKTIGFNEKFLKSENLKQFDLLPNPFLQKTVDERIKLFLGFQEEKLLHCSDEIYDQFIDQNKEYREMMQAQSDQNRYQKMAIERARVLWTEIQ